MHYFLIFIALIFLNIANAVEPINAENCVGMDVETIADNPLPKAVLVNTCDERVYIFWCHLNTGDYLCGGNKYYRQGRYFSPGERFSNQYTVPLYAQLKTGACKGTYSKIEFQSDGTYRCPTSAPAQPTTNMVQVTCDDGRELEFEWTLKAKVRNGVAVRLGTGAILVNSDDWQSFEQSEYREIPQQLREKACEQPPAPPEGSWYWELKSQLRKALPPEQDAQPTPSAALGERS